MKLTESRKSKSTADLYNSSSDSDEDKNGAEGELGSIKSKTKLLDWAYFLLKLNLYQIIQNN